MQASLSQCSVKQSLRTKLIANLLSRRLVSRLLLNTLLLHQAVVLDLPCLQSGIQEHRIILYIKIPVKLRYHLERWESKVYLVA